MNISGKTIIFVKEVGKDNQIKIFETTFAHKDANGKYLDNVTARVEFSKELLPDEKKAKFKAGYAYPMEIIEGFITTRGYDGKDGKRHSEISLMVKKAKTTGQPKKITERKPKQEELKFEEDGTIIGSDGEPLPL